MKFIYCLLNYSKLYVKADNNLKGYLAMGITLSCLNNWILSSTLLLICFLKFSLLNLNIWFCLFLLWSDAKLQLTKQYQSFRFSIQALFHSYALNLQQESWSHIFQHPNNKIYLISNVFCTHHFRNQYQR